jgi:DNA-binding transcriptional ArsR family regulator
MAASGDSQLDAVFHALADLTRRQILDELAKRDDQPLFEICVRLVEGHGISLTRQAISKHLAVLATRWEGRTKLHSSNLSSHLPRVAKWLNQHRS